jgi:hypothetical protein
MQVAQATDEAAGEVAVRCEKIAPAFVTSPLGCASKTRVSGPIACAFVDAPHKMQSRASPAVLICEEWYVCGRKTAQ